MSNEQPGAAVLSTLTAAFPADLADDVRVVLAAMPAAVLAPASSFSVSVAGEGIVIPKRIYNPVPTRETVAALTPNQQTILGCLYSRQHDGHVRQRQAEQVMRCAEPWVVPYVVQLVGEYVLEILVDIDHGLPEIAFVGTTFHDLYGQFLAANPSFFATTERRVVSYWSRYYRKLYSDFRTYPGSNLLAKLHDAAKHAAGHRWPSYAPPGFRELHGYC